MVVLLLALPGVAIEPRPGRDVGLHADDRLDAGGPGGLVELQRAEHRPVVGHRQRRHAVRDRLGEDRRRRGVGLRRLDPRRPVQQRVLRVRCGGGRSSAPSSSLRRSPLRAVFSTARRCLWTTYTHVIRWRLEPYARGPRGVKGAGPAAGEPRAAVREVRRQRLLHLDRARRSSGGRSASRQECRNGRSRPSRRASSPPPP